MGAYGSSMVNRVYDNQNVESRYRNDLPVGIDYQWFDERFRHLLERIAFLEESISHNEPRETAPRQYYSVEEFASQVERSPYTVREWCRLSRIHAEKCDTGHGEAKNWKISAEELQRYRDHGLLAFDRYHR
jgi:hypothetical protein